MRNVSKPLKPSRITSSTHLPEKSILLYLSIIEYVIGSMVGQENDGKNERAVYYLNKRLHDYEKKIHIYREIISRLLSWQVSLVLV